MGQRCVPALARIRLGARALSLAAIVLCAGGASARSISITGLPPHGAFGSLTGTVAGVEFATHRVATYVHAEGAGWYTKPTFASPTVPIDANGHFAVDVTTGGLASLDPHATLFCAVLVPDGVAPEPADGAPRIAAALAPYPTDCEERWARTLSFAGLA